jgi:hypothetical protein
MVATGEKGGPWGFLPGDVFVNRIVLFRIMLDFGPADENGIRRVRRIPRENYMWTEENGTPLTDDTGQRLTASGPRHMQEMVQLLRPGFVFVRRGGWNDWDIERGGVVLGTLTEHREWFWAHHPNNPNRVVVAAEGEDEEDAGDG